MDQRFLSRRFPDASRFDRSCDCRRGDWSWLGDRKPHSSGRCAGGGLAGAGNAPNAKPAAKPATKPATKPAAAPELSPELAVLRDQIRRTLVLYFHEPINTADNTPAEVLQFCLAFGCDTEIRYGGSAGTAMSGIGCLCWDYPCGNYQLLLPDQKRIMARIGYGFQEQPCELPGHVGPVRRARRL